MSTRPLRRAQVALRDPFDDDVTSEWVHEHELETSDYGVTLDWGQAETFIPWANIARIDFGPCKCMDCTRAEAGPA